MTPKMNGGYQTMTKNVWEKSKNYENPKMP